ncbi:MAG: hypothetical protein IT318_12020 [Anaerolineales bacterium]|nr:hypothetical protein [Anaerolineales bacterium]
MTIAATPIAVSVKQSKPQRRVRVLPKRELLGLLATLAGPSGIGVIYEVLAERADARAYPPPGQMVTVDGRHIHLQIAGNDTGQPRALLKAGEEIGWQGYALPRLVAWSPLAASPFIVVP